MSYFYAFRKMTAVEAKPLPPLSAYEAWRAEKHPNPQGRGPSARQYRRLAACRRAGATIEEQARAVGVSANLTRQIYDRLPPELR